MSKPKESHISDFLLAYRIINIVCHQLDADFVDIRIDFKPGVEPYFSGNAIILPEEEILPKNIFSMVSIYVSYLKTIVGASLPSNKDRDNVIHFALSLIRGLSYDYENENMANIVSDQDESFLMRLDQYPLVWGLLKNIICPAENLEFKNLKIVAGHSGVVDACVFVDEDKEKMLTNNHGSFVFVNLDVESNSVRSAFLLYESLIAICGSKEEAIKTISSTFCNFFMKQRMIEYVRMAFTCDKEASSFFAILSILCFNEELERMAFEVYGNSKNDKMNRTAQMDTNWWFLGLTEKMLEPARSEDWSLTNMWKPITDELWNRVETERRRRGLDEVPFEMLLRINSDDRSIGEPMTLQALLSDERVW